MEGLIQLLSDHTLRTVALGSAIIGLTSGVLGSYALLRRESLLGDAMSHAALPGIALAFLLVRSKEPAVLLLGALVVGWIGALTVMGIVTYTRIKEDAALGTVLSVFFGFGMVLLTFIQRLPTAAQAGLDRYLFGQAATLLQRDVVVMGTVAAVALALVALFWKEFKALTFDPAYLSTLGFPVRLLDVVLTSLIVLAIVTGLQTVGVVLMSAMLVAPAAAARQWTDRLSGMVVLAGLFGALAGVVGALLSSLVPRLPTGPTIVLTISAIVACSLLFAPNRGLVWQRLAALRRRQRLRATRALLDLYALTERHADPFHPHHVAVLRTVRGEGVEPALEELQAQGLVQRVHDGLWALTPAGLERARDLLSRPDREEEVAP